MSNWQPGDLALCLKSEWRNACTKQPSERPAPRAGQVYTVAHVRPGKFVDGDVLSFPAAPSRFFAAEMFVKVTPGADVEGEEMEKRVPRKQEQDA